MRRSTLYAAGLLAAVAGAATSQAAVTISSKPTKNLICTSGVCTPTAKDAVLNVGDLASMLATSGVKVTTGSGMLARQVRDIDISAGFSWASASALTLDAYDSVAFSKPVSVAGTGAVVLTTNDGGKGGELLFGNTASLSFLSASNSLTINGSAYTLASTIAALAADIASNPSGHYALSANYNAKSDGAYGTAPVATTFEGVFNGLGNTISHLSIRTKAQGLNLGLFADVDTAGAVSSIRVTDAGIRAGENSYAGVIAGMNYGTIFNSAAGGSITAGAGKSEGVEGGLVGLNEGTLSETAASTNVEAGGRSPFATAYVGGLAGANSGTIDQSYALGSAATSNGIGIASTGGLVGFNNGTIENCYADGAATMGGSRVGAGGLVGVNGLTIETAYSTGAAIANEGGAFGGSIGIDESDGGISNDFWDTTTSGITNLSQGAGSPANDPGITGETTAQLQAGLPAGFDPTIWAENPSINNGLPYLIANPPR
jgi:hypothetical protein